MEEKFRLGLEGNILAELGKIREEYGKLLKSVDGLDDSVKKGFDAIKEGAEKTKASMSVLTMEVLGRGADLLAVPFRKGTDAVYDYDKALKGLSAITDITGPQLDNLGNMARNMSEEFGGTPAEHLNSYTRLLSALTPEIANSEVALDSFGRTVAMLGNTMDGDAVGAVRALETAMNQYGIDLSDPIKASKEAAAMANTIAAAAKVGKVEVPGLADALTRSGAEAAAAGVKFSSLNAALEVAGKFFGSTERLGTAMRGVMSTIGSGALPPETLKALQQAGVNMSVVTNQSLPLKERLMELKKIAGDGGLMEKVFGAGETIAGRGLLNNLDLLDQYEAKMMDMPDALNQMSDVMNSTYAKSKEKIQNFFGNIRDNIFMMTGDALPALDLIGGGLTDIIMLAPGVMALSEAFKTLALTEKIAAFWTTITTSAAWGFAAALWANPITWVVAGVLAFAAGLVWLFKNVESVRGAVYGLWGAFKQVFSNVADFFKQTLGPIFDAINLAMQGKWTEAAKVAGKGVLTFVMGGDGLTKGVGEAYDKGVNTGRMAFAADQKKDQPKTAAEQALDFATEKPMIPTSDPSVAMKQSAGGGGEKAGGGGKIITVHINQLVGTIQNHIAGANADMTKIREAVKEALVASVRDFELSGV